MTPTLGTVRHVLRCAVVAGRDDTPDHDDDRAHSVPGAIGTLPNGECDAHEVPVRVRASGWDSVGGHCQGIYGSVASGLHSIVDMSSNKSTEHPLPDAGAAEREEPSPEPKNERSPEEREREAAYR